MSHRAVVSVIACCLLLSSTLHAVEHLRVVLNAEEKGMSAVVTCLAMQPQGNLLVTGGDDHAIRLWDGQTGLPVARWQRHHDWVQDIRFMPDGLSFLSTGKDGLVLLWDSRQEAKFHVIAHRPHALNSLDVDPQGRLVAIAGATAEIQFFDTQSWQEQVSLRHRMPCADVRCVRFSPQQDTMASCARTGPIHIWKVHEGTQAVQRLGQAKDRSRTLAFSWDGVWLAAGGDDREIRLWHLPSLSLADRPNAIPPTHTIPLGNTKVFSLAFVGSQILALGGSDNRIQLWDIAKQERVGAFTGHTGSVSALAFGADRLVSGSYDTTLRFWTDPSFESTVGPLTRVKVASQSAAVHP